MSSSGAAAAAEDVMQALMEYLVAPMLPFKSSGCELPSVELQMSVAKQVHGAVLLYNYYYRKQQPQAEFLGFKSFCQLAVIVKPTLMGHMKLMHHSDFSELDDVENQLSMTEKAIMDACDISSALDPSQNTPGTENWEVSKVAVLLTDSSKENCWLKFSSTTQGVWSLIEKDVPFPREERKYMNKRKRNAKKSQGNGVMTDKAGLQRLALSAVKEATGFHQGDLLVLESHTVYSLSREKSTVQFYIVQCNLSIDAELKLPIKDIMESLQGPLVGKRNCGWAVTPVVEYFHLLPYAGIIEEWFSREVISNSLQGSMVGTETVDVESPHKGGNSFDNQDRDDLKSKSNVLDSADMQSCGTGSTIYLKQKNATASRGVQDVNDENSQMIDNPSVTEYNKDEVDCGEKNDKTNIVANGCNRTYIEVLAQKNDNGSAMVCKSDSLGGSQNMGIADCSMVYCLRDGEIGNVDVKSCQIIDNLFDQEVSKDKFKCGKNTKATDSNTNKMRGINAESFKQITSNRIDPSGLHHCNIDQQSMDIDDSSMVDESCEYGLKSNAKTNTDSNDNKKTGINIESSKDRTDYGTDLSGLLDCHATQQNMSGINVECSKLITDKETDMDSFRDGHLDQQTIVTDNSMMDEACKHGLQHNEKINTDSNENKQCRKGVEFPKQIIDNGTELSALPACHTTQQNMDTDDSMFQNHNDDKLSNGSTITKVYRHKKRTSSSKFNTNGKLGGLKVKLERMDSVSNSFIPKFKDGKTDKGNETRSIMCSNQNGPIIGDQAIIPYQLNAEYHNKFQVIQASAENALSQTALTYLLKKKSKLAHQLRLLEDEIAVCDKNIQTILDGGESELVMQVEAIVDACYDASLKSAAETQEWACQQFGTQVSPQFGRKRLSDAVIPSRNSCQELDDICQNNCWTLPAYQLYPVNGRFRASIKLKGTDFKYYEESDLCVKPRLARESAAEKMIAKLRGMAGRSQ